MELDKKKLKKQLEKMNQTELNEFLNKQFIEIDNIEDMTKEQIIDEIIMRIDMKQFYRDYYS